MTSLSPYRPSCDSYSLLLDVDILRVTGRVTSYGSLIGVSSVKVPVRLIIVLRPGLGHLLMADGKVYLGGCVHDIMTLGFPLLRTLEAHVILAGEDGFGQVSDGHPRVRGQLFGIEIRDSDSIFVDGEEDKAWLSS